MSVASCWFCNKYVDQSDPDKIYREVTSWVTGPKLQSPVLREQSGRVAHKECVENQVAGQAADQPTLDDPIVEKIATLQEGANAAQFCDELAVKGTGTGLHGIRLDENGECPRWRDHIL